MDLKHVIAGLFFLFILLSGFWLSLIGKPYSMIIITIHKLIGLAIGIYLAISVYRLHQAGQLSPVGIAAIVVTIMLFIGLVTTGGLLSTEKPVPLVVSMIHKRFPYLTVLSSGVTIYLLS